MGLPEAILEFVGSHPNVRRGEIRAGVVPDRSDATVWRALKALVEDRMLVVAGRGPATRYRVADVMRIRAHLETPFHRRVPVGYRRAFLDAYIPNDTVYLEDGDRTRLREAGTPSEQLPAGTYARRILTRWLVDLTWASSRMEGNTYDILQTERLIEAGEEAAGKDRAEALMILNHRDAIRYVADNLADADIDRRTLCDIHALLSNGLLYDPALAGRLRRLPVAIGRSAYLPLEDEFDIAAEFEVLLAKATTITDPFEQSFFVLVHLPYLQPFADVNKRTSRIAANVPLLKAGLAPLSFLATEDRDYVDGLLGVYELNDVALLRQVFLDTYLSSARQYTALRAQMDSPHRVALVHREFVGQVIRRCVLDWRAFRHGEVVAMAAAAGIPGDDHQAVAAYVEGEFNGLHEGNAVRYKLSAASLAHLERPPSPPSAVVLGASDGP